MSRSKVVILLFVIWNILFSISILSLFLLEPTGDGFARGLNRISAFLGWQAIALVVAMIAFSVGFRRFPKSRLLRWLARLPALVQLILGLGITTLIAFSVYESGGDSQAAPPQTQMPTTAPAD